MPGNIIEQACVSIPLLGSELNSVGITEIEELVNILTKAPGEFCIAIEAGKL